MNNTVRTAVEPFPGPRAEAPTRTHGRMHLWMLAATFFWASNIVAGKAALRGFGPLALAQLRVAGAALVLVFLVLVWPNRPRLRLELRQGLSLIWVALFGITLNQIFFIGGLSRTSVAHTGVIVALGPVMVLVLSCRMGLESLTVLKFVGMLISFAGVGILTIGKAAQASGASLRGDLIILAGSATFAYYTVLVKDIAHQQDALTLNAIIFVLGAVMMMPFAERDILNLRWAGLPLAAWWGLAFMVFFGTVAAYLIYALALTELTATRVAAFSYLQPVIATGLGIWLLGENLTGRVVCGGALILLGVFLSEREGDEEKQVQGAARVVA